MSMIVISRGSYTRGKEVAEKLARKLGMACISRDSLIDTLDAFHIPELKLIRDIHDAISLLDRFPYGKERYVVAMRAALLKQFNQDNLVYHGLAGHVVLENITHVLKVRIVADIELRVKEEMDRAHISAQEARFILKKDDEERRKWSLYLYGIDIWDPTLYHLVLNIGDITVDDAVGTISNTVNLPCFATTRDSKQKLADMALAAQVQGSLFEFPSARVSAKDGQVRILLKAPAQQRQTIVSSVESTAKKAPGVTDVRIHFEPYL